VRYQGCNLCLLCRWVHAPLFFRQLPIDMALSFFASLFLPSLFLILYNVPLLLTFRFCLSFLSLARSPFPYTPVSPREMIFPSQFPPLPRRELRLFSPSRHPFWYLFQHEVCFPPFYCADLFIRIPLSQLMSVFLLFPSASLVSEPPSHFRTLFLSLSLAFQPPMQEFFFLHLFFSPSLSVVMIRILFRFFPLCFFPRVVGLLSRVSLLGAIGIRMSSRRLGCFQGFSLQVFNLAPSLVLLTLYQDIPLFRSNAEDPRFLPLLLTVLYVLPKRAVILTVSFYSRLIHHPSSPSFFPFPFVLKFLYLITPGPPPPCSKFLLFTYTSFLLFYIPIFSFFSPCLSGSGTRIFVPIPYPFSFPPDLPPPSKPQYDFCEWQKPPRESLLYG